MESEEMISSGQRGGVGSGGRWEGRFGSVGVHVVYARTVRHALVVSPTACNLPFLQIFSLSTTLFSS